MCACAKIARLNLSHENPNIRYIILSLFSLSIESTDFALRDTPVVLSGGLSDVRLDASNDDVTLEYGDTVILRLDPTDANIVDLVEGQGQFLRDTATVTILDNDCKQPLQSIENCFVKTVIEFKVYYINCQVFAFQEVVSETCLSFYSLTRNQLAYSGQEWAIQHLCVPVCLCVLMSGKMILSWFVNSETSSQSYSMSHGSALTELCWISECTCYY